MHPKNPHQGRYDFDALCQSCPDLKQYLQPSPAGDETIDFSDPASVLCLNQALLAHYYGVARWMIPPGYLCPPIPGRADYIHYLADLLADSFDGEVPTGSKVKVLDIGTGANGIYPIIGSQAYGWKFVGTDIDPVSIKAVRAIAEANPCLRNHVRVVQQKDRSATFRGIIKPTDRFDVTMCNPPFHDSPEAAEAGSQRKVKNLSKGKLAAGAAKRNFGGQHSELWCSGGEVGFIARMIEESVDFAQQVGCFTSLVSKSESLPRLKKVLTRFDAKLVDIVEMRQGQKVSRLVAWKF